MIKFVGNLPQGNMYGFGLTEANLNRMEFNNEFILFDFGYAEHPEIFGLILYLRQFKEPIDISNNIDTVLSYRTSFLDSNRGVTSETLRFFPLAQSVMQKFSYLSILGF